MTEPRSPLHRRWLSFGLVGQIATAVGLVATVVGLLFTFFPNLRPGGGGNAPKPSGTLQLSDVNPRATLLDYQLAERIPIGSLSKAVLRRVGVLTTIHYSSTGFRGKELQLDVTLTSRDLGLVCAHTYPIEAGDGAPISFRVWSPFPPHPRANDSYDLHVTLFPPSGHSPSLDAADQHDIPVPLATSTAPLPLDIC